MALADILEAASGSKRKIGISEERIAAIKPIARQYIAYWREYPDMFIDFLQTGEEGKIPDNGLHFYFYQRVFLRVCMRYKNVYMVFPRGYSKSFLAVLTLMIRCILYPRAALAVTSGGKEQSASIIKEKVDQLCNLVPALGNELDLRPGKTKSSKDQCIFVFKNGSYFDNVAANEKSRGRRRHGILVEECVGVDGKVLNEIIIPMLNIDRLCMDGTSHESEVLNKSQVFVTTAGQKNQFAYQKLIQFLVLMITNPERAFIMGGTWRTPVLTGLLSKTFVDDLKRDGTYNEASFDREYESKWGGTADGAFFDVDIFEKNRHMQKPEYEYSGRSTKTSFYVLSADIGRKGDQTVICVFKVIPQNVSGYIKSLVNIYVYDNLHFEDQARILKTLFYKYKARRLVIDGNGAGIGLIDYMVKAQGQKLDGDYLPSFGVYNDEDNYYKKYQVNDTEQEAIYIIKANAPINTEAHVNAQVQLSTGKVKLLIDERTAQQKLLGTKMGQQMTNDERANYLKPFNLTSILIAEALNLREENEGVNIKLKQANRSIGHDKFSSFEYGLYYIKQEEEGKKKRKRFSAKDWTFMN